MGGSLSQLPPADNFSNSIHSERISRRQTHHTLTQKSSLLNSEGRNQKFQGPDWVKSEHSLAPSEHALFTGGKRRSTSAKCQDLPSTASDQPIRRHASCVERTSTTKPPRPEVKNGILQITQPKQHDNSILAFHALTILTFASEYSPEKAISLALMQMQTAIRECKGVDLVVDFIGLSESTLQMNGAALIRRIIADAASRRGFCQRVFFIDFPDEYRRHCARWRNELPRDFRQRIWCVTSDNLEHVLPDYVHCSRDWHPFTPPNTQPTMTNIPISEVIKSKSSLKGIIETSSRDLCFQQFTSQGQSEAVFTSQGQSEAVFTSQGRSEAVFTIRNINQSSFVVCRFLPQRAIYTITPSRTFLLPYPKRQTVKITTQNEQFPAIGDVIRLQVYVLNPEDGHQIPPLTDAKGMRSFMSKQEIMLKRGCDLIVAEVTCAGGDHHSKSEKTDCELFELTSACAGEWDGGNESSYDWTAESNDGDGGPQCLAETNSKSTSNTVPGSTQTNVLPSTTIYIQTEEAPISKKPVAFEAGKEIQQAQPKITQSGTMQTDSVLRMTHSGVVQTEDEPLKSTHSNFMQTDSMPQLAVTRIRSASGPALPPQQWVQSGSMQTDPEPLPVLKSVKSAFGQTSDLFQPAKQVSSGFMQTDKEPEPSLKSVKSGVAQTDQPLPGVIPKVLQSQFGQTDPLDVKPVNSGFSQTDEQPLPHPRPVKSGLTQTDPPLVKPVKSDFHQTDELPTLLLPQPKVVKSGTGQTDIRPVFSISIQTDEQVQSPPRAVKSGFGQTEPVPRTQSDNMQTDSIPSFVPPLPKVIKSGFGQTEPLPTTQSDIIQTDSIPSFVPPLPKSVKSGFEQTDSLPSLVPPLPKAVKSRFGQTEPAPPTLSNTMQTDTVPSFVPPLPKAVRSGFGQTDPPPSNISDFMQTDEPPALILHLPKPIKSVFGQTDQVPTMSEFMQTDFEGQMNFTQTNPIPLQTSDLTQTDVRKIQSGMMQTDQMEVTPTNAVHQFHSGTNQTEIASINEIGVGDIPLLMSVSGAFQTEQLQQSSASMQTDIKPVSTMANQIKQVAQGLAATQTDQIQEKLAPVKSAKDIRSDFMQTDDEPTKQPGNSKNTQTDLTRSEFRGVQTDDQPPVPKTMTLQPQQPIQIQKQSVEQPMAIVGNVTREVTRTSETTVQEKLRTSEPTIQHGKVTVESIVQQEQIVQRRTDSLPLPLVTVQQRTDSLPRAVPPVTLLSAQTDVVERAASFVEVRDTTLHRQISHTTTHPQESVQVSEVQSGIRENVTTLIESARNFSLPSFDWRPFGLLAAFLFLLFFGYWLELHKVADDYIWVADWGNPKIPADVGGSIYRDTIAKEGTTLMVPATTTRQRNSYFTTTTPTSDGDSVVLPGFQAQHRGVSGPAYHDHDTSRSYISKLVFGSSSPGPDLDAGNHALTKFNPEWMGVLSIKKGLELTTPELGLTKQWLHGWPFRFDFGTRERWDGLRLNPNVLHECRLRNEEYLHKKRCLDEYWSIDRYVMCRIAAFYDHGRWGI